MPLSFYIRKDLTSFNYGGYNPQMLGIPVERVIHYKSYTEIKPEDAKKYGAHTAVLVYSYGRFPSFHMRLYELEVK